MYHVITPLPPVVSHPQCETIPPSPLPTTLAYGAGGGYYYYY